MDNRFAITVGLILVAVIGGFWLARPSVNVNTPPAVVNNVGSASSPSVINGCMDIEGVQNCYATASFPTGTTTLCSFRAPLTGTSTLIYATAKVTTGSTTATTFEWGKSNTTFDATTTSLGIALLGGSAGTNATGVLQASTTASALVSTGLNPGGVDDRTVFAPGAYLNFKYGNSNCTAGGTCSALVGTCKAHFLIN